MQNCNLTLQKTGKSVFFALAILFASSSLVNAAESERSVSQISPPIASEAQLLPNHASIRNTPILTAELRNYCGSESVWFSAETSGFWINICGGDRPHTYVGVSKSDGSSIRLSVSDYTDEGSWFEARNGNVVYEILRGTAKGSFLLVTQGDRTLVRQPLIDWQ